MSFWAKKLGGNPLPAPTIMDGPPTHEPWWVEEGTTPRQPDYTAPTHASAPAIYAPRGASSARHRERCPVCDSGNYMSGSRSVAARCFDCGYPIEQSTSGMVADKNTPHGKPVRQVLGDGFHPYQFIAKIGSTKDIKSVGRIQ